MSTKIDFKKEWKHLYRPSAKQPVIVEVPPLNYLMIDGKGNPNTSQAYQDAMQTLFPVSYALKFASKKTLGKDYVVPPLEGLWWGTPQGQTRFSAADKALWSWTSLMMVPDFISAEMVMETIASVKESKQPPAIDKVRFETLQEGLSVQVMHIGPFEDEGPTAENMHAFAAEQGYTLTGKHHEIYLSDFRKVDPTKNKVILRHPIKPAAG